MRLLLLLALLLATTAHAQSCPQETSDGPTVPSSSVTLTGKLVYHNEIRQWFELQLAKPVCGQTSVQLFSEKTFQPDDKPDTIGKSIETLRGCTVTTHGKLDLPLTAYYSAEIFQSVTEVEPQSGCVRQPPFPDYSKLKPDPSINSYRVNMEINYGPRGGPVTATILSGKRPLTPWQVYGSYWLTGGGDIFYGRCADGFAVSNVSGTPQGHPGNFDESGSPDNMAMFEPESAAVAHIFHQHLTYTCRRLQ